MTSKNTRRASLAELRAMTDRGEVQRGEPLTEDDRLPAAFWAETDDAADRAIATLQRLRRGASLGGLFWRQLRDADRR